MGLGAFDKAFVLQEKALATHRAELGPEHPKTLRSMNNLAGAVLLTGWNRAQPLSLISFLLHQSPRQTRGRTLFEPLPLAVMPCAGSLRGASPISWSGLPVRGNQKGEPDKVH